MVMREGKKRMRAVLDSSNGEKKNEGESSLSRVDAPGMRELKRRREEEQRFNTSRPVSPSFLSLV
jgi:hypothetical protein